MSAKVFSSKRMLICTFIALTSGAFGSFLGGQISWSARTYQCRNQPEGLLNAACQLMSTGGSITGVWAGMWTGTILGAFIGGLVTREQVSEQGNSDVGDDRGTPGS